MQNKMSSNRAGDLARRPAVNTKSPQLIRPMMFYLDFMLY
jgi:hypothetical protein